MKNYCTFFISFVLFFSLQSVQASSGYDSLFCHTSCIQESDCTSQYSCFEGSCRLKACIPDYYNVENIPAPPGFEQSISSPLVAGDTNPKVPVCSNDGCKVIGCGMKCGESLLCPKGCPCNAEGICGAIQVPKHYDFIILSVFSVLILYLLYRFEFLAHIGFKKTHRK